LVLVAAVLVHCLQLAYTFPWIIMLSQLAHYSKIYGPQVGIELSQTFESTMMAVAAGSNLVPATKTHALAL
jgi:hypothetical protein